MPGARALLLSWAAPAGAGGRGGSQAQLWFVLIPSQMALHSASAWSQDILRSPRRPGCSHKPACTLGEPGVSLWEVHWQTGAVLSGGETSTNTHYFTDTSQTGCHHTWFPSAMQGAGEIQPQYSSVTNARQTMLETQRVPQEQIPLGQGAHEFAAAQL